MNGQLCYSPLTDRIYWATNNEKKDVTDEFIFCVIARWENESQVITYAGKKFEIQVRELEQKNEN